MAYNIFESFGLKDDIDTQESEWVLRSIKTIPDSDGFMTEYAWYTNGDKHIFMFGDTDLYEPNEQDADWVCETEQEAQEWFNSYEGFEDSENQLYTTDPLEDDLIEDELEGNADFINDGFDKVYGITEERSLNLSLKHKRN